MRLVATWAALGVLGYAIGTPLGRVLHHRYAH